MKTIDTLPVELIPLFKILESFTFVLNDNMSMSSTKRIPYMNLLVEVTVVSVLNCIFDNFTDLLFKKVDFLDFKGSRLNNQKCKVSNLTKI